MGKTAIDAPRESIFKVLPEDIIVIGIDTEHGPEHPLYDKTFRHEIHEPTVLNIMDLGVDQTCSVWKDPDLDAYVAVDGRRRILHAREANKRLKKNNEVAVRVPVRIRKGAPALMERVSAALNSVRMDESPTTKAAKIARMLRRNGGDVNEVAITMGCTVQTVKTYEKLDNLPAKVKRAVDDGKISGTAAVKLDGLPKDEMESTLDKLIAEGGGKRVTVDRTKRATAASNGKTVAPKKSTLKKLVVRHGEMLGSGTDPEGDDELDVSEEFMRGVRFAIGDLNAKSVKGLSKLLSEL